MLQNQGVIAFVKEDLSEIDDLSIKTNQTVMVPIITSSSAIHY